MERLTAWWGERSEREQILLGIMTALLLIVIGWLAILRPLDNRLAQARIDNETAYVRLERVRSDAAALQSGGSVTREPVQALVKRLAEEAGFAPNRLDPGAEGRVTIGLASAKPIALMKWLQALDAQGVFVDQISIRSNSDATLAIDATLRARSR